MSYYDEEEDLDDDYEPSNEYEENDDSSEDNGGFNQGGNNGSPVGTAMKNKAKQKGKEAVKKIGKKLLKEGGKALMKVLGSIIKYLIATLGPYILVIFIVLILLYFAWDIIFNSRGKTQDYQSEDTNEYNNIKIDENTGDAVATDLSIGNKLTKAFYTYFAEKSLYITVTDKNGKVTQKEPIQYNSPDFIKKYGEGSNRTIKDKYNREKMFYLNPNALWSLDEFLHQNKFRFPEQFIKPVYHDADTFALKQLTNDKGELVAESTKYSLKDTLKMIYKKDTDGQLKRVYVDNATGKDTFSPSTNGRTNNPKTENSTSMIRDTNNEKEKGVWDYGFGSILNYKEFEEERKAIGYFKTMNIWDVENEKMIYNVPLDEAETMCKNEPEKYEGFDSNYPKDKEFEDKLPSGTSYMIDRVTSPAGFVTNNIKSEWQDTGKKYAKTIPLEKNVSVWREYERQVNRYGYLIYIDENGYETIDAYSEDEDGNKTYHSPKMEKYKKKEKIKKTFYIEGEGTEHEKIPRYEGDPDLSQITGTKYYMDYMTNYKAYVPQNVMTNLGISDFTSRTGVKQEELLKLLERQSFSGETVGTVDLGSFEFGSGASSQNFLNAMQYYDDFVLWGETYGIDPMLLVAIASQESGGKHDAYVNSSRCATAGCGIMQIEKPGIVIKNVTAYNFKTGAEDTMDIPSMGAIASAKDNIRAGAMIQANRMKGSNYNMLFGLQSYNFGSGAFKLAVDKYASDTGKTYEDILNDPNDIGWTAYVLDFHKNPNSYLSTPWYDNSGVACAIPTCDEQGGHNHYGDPGYLQNVLRYYVSEDGSYPWVINEDNTKVSMNGSEFQMGAGTPGGSNDSWLKKIWDNFAGKKNEIFPMMPPELMPQTTAYTHKLPKAQAEIVYKMMFVMEEKKLLSEYEDFDDEDWKAKFNLWFSNPIGSKWKGKGGLVDSNGIFPEGVDKPLKFSPLTIDKAFELPNHGGIDIVAPVGTDVFAVSDGVVLDTNDKGAKGRGKYVEIKHSSGAVTIYGGLSDISVKKGDKVKRGNAIGKTGNTHDKKNVLYFELIYQNKTTDPTWIISGNFNASDYNMSKEDAVIIEQIIQLAHTKIGCEYTQAQGRRSGANSFDCSGFTWWLYHTTTGKNIGSWTGEQDQFLNNYRVSADKLQPGDILMTSDLSHVVLYIGKENGVDTVIHAANENLGVIKSKYTNITSIYPKIYRPIAYARSN